MIDSLLAIMSSAMDRFGEHCKLVGIDNIDEFTFRSFIVAEVLRRYPTARCQTEWRKFDLLMQFPDGNHLAEFKLYVTRRAYALDGSPMGWKGGAGLKNESEFYSCVRKLKDASIEGISGKYLVLAYEQSCGRTSRHSFAKSYGHIAVGRGVTGTYSVDHHHQDQLVCKLLTVE